MYFLTPGVKECIYCFSNERWRKRALQRELCLAGQNLWVSFFLSLKKSIKDFLWKKESFIVKFPTVCVEIYFEFDCII